jgi:hypothetical protein
MTQSSPAPASRKTLIIGTALALIVGGAILTLFVLPAEFGIDPFGVGKATGLSGLSSTGTSPELERGAKRKGVLTLSDTPLSASPGASDQWQIELQPYESVEFKYQLAKDAPMTFVWRASKTMNYDMHAHPFDGGEALTESYGVGEATVMQGRYVAAFTGIHGWYWQNRTLEPVTLTLTATGGFTSSSIFDDRGEHKRAVGALSQTVSPHG